MANLPEYTLRDFTPEASVCSACGHKIATYRRQLYSSLTRWLMHLAAHSEQSSDGWVNVSEMTTRAKSLIRGGDYAKLRYWGLIEQTGINKDDGNPCSGMWRPTERGFRFAVGKTQVPSHVILRDGVCIGYNGRLVTIQETLGKNFSYGVLLVESGLTARY